MTRLRERSSASAATLRRCALVLVLAIVGPVATGTVAASAATSDPTVVPGQALVRFKSGTADTLKQAAHARAGAAVIRRIPVLGYDLVRFPAEVPLDAVLTSYRSDPNVSVVEPNRRGILTLSPSDACHVTPCAGTPGQWHLNQINTPFGWDRVPAKTFTAAEKLALPRVSIAVLDTKIDTSHPDWINPGGTAEATGGGQLDLANARDWVPPSLQSGSAAYHGTFVAGLAAAATGNGKDSAGVGYSATVLPLTVVDGGGKTDAATLADAIVYAWQRGARVINLSLGILGHSQAVHDAIRLVTTAADPSLVVAAAGNNTGSIAFYPGSYPEVMSVSGTDANDGRAPCSNYNANVSVSAPADRLIGLAPMPGERIQAPCGTSSAAPQVSALAALLFFQDPTRTPAQVRRMIESSADDLGAPGRDDVYGHGRINVERALATTGPRTVGARASVPPASGGNATVTAVATSPNGVRAAQVFFDRPDATPVPMSAADGALGGTTESLRVSITIPAGTAPGPHTVWVRAFDGVSWGPATTGIVGVDGRAPTISGIGVSNGVRATRQPVAIAFSIADDYSTSFSYGIEFRSTATNAVVYRAARYAVAGGAQRFEWLPGLEVPAGHLKVKIAVADTAGNVSSVETGALLT